MTLWQTFDDELGLWREAGKQVRFWLRDDDAVTPTPALEHLLTLDLPVTIAAIPATATGALADRLADEAEVDVAVHGYAHQNHAPPGEKKREIGLERGRATILGELAAGLERMRTLFGNRLLPLLVPPWNRIDEELLTDLPSLGFAALSTFGDKAIKPVQGLKVVNTHIDIIDWRGNRSGKSLEAVIDELVQVLRIRRMNKSTDPIGILAHHLVHDDAAWHTLDGLAARISLHDNASWTSSRALLAER